SDVQKDPGLRWWGHATGGRSAWTNFAARDAISSGSVVPPRSGLPTPTAQAPAAAYSAARSSVTPPVGTSFNPGSGTSMARRKEGAIVSAGNNFTASAPKRTAFIASVGV